MTETKQPEFRIIAIDATDSQASVVYGVYGSIDDILKVGDKIDEEVRAGTAQAVRHFYRNGKLNVVYVSQGDYFDLNDLQSFEDELRRITNNLE